MSGAISGTSLAVAGIGAAGAIGGGLLAAQGGKAQASAMEAGQQTQAASLRDQLALQQKALDQQQAQYTQNVAMEQPYMDAGAGALSEYDQLLGIHPMAAPGTPQLGALSTPSTSGGTTPHPSLQQGTVPAPTAVGSAPPAPAMDPNTGLPARTAATAGTLADQQMAALSNTPGYKFQLDQGTAAMERGAASTTGVLSSAEQQNLLSFGQGLANTTYNSFMDRLNGQSTLGQQAASQTVAAGQANADAQGRIAAGSVNAMANTAGNISQLQAGVGAARASGFNGAAGALTGGANNIGNQLALSSMLNNGGGGGGSLTSEELAIQPPG